MSLVAIYHDPSKAIIVSDDRMCCENPVTLQKQRVDGRVTKIVALPRGRVFGSIGRVDLTRQLLGGISRMCQARSLSFEQIADALPHILKMAWTARPPLQLSDGVNKQDNVFLGADRHGKIKCISFRSEDDFRPIETTADPNVRILVLGGYDVSDQELLQTFTADIGVRGQRQKPAWIAAKMRDLVNQISSLHPESIGAASFFSALNREGPIALPPEFPPSPSPDELISTQPLGAHAEAGYMFVGSIRTPPSGGAPTIGNDDGGGGTQIGMRNILEMSLSGPSAGSPIGNAAITNAQYAIDGDSSTFCAMTATGDGGLNEAELQIYGPPGLTRGYSSATLYVTFAVPTNSLAGGGLSPLATVFEMTYSTTGPGGSGSGFTGSFGAPGTTVPKTTVAIPLPLGLNLSQIALLCEIFTHDSVHYATSGAIELDIYEAYVVATE